MVRPDRGSGGRHRLALGSIAGKSSLSFLFLEIPDFIAILQ
ncbi:hypothetical protein C943_01328 [Mariniradius saccharolyticus AK6]|uniref:Uncharacterized protein n=1 Tax=Mariniradius saccharolyticus AK6 TaxID=1239962 RepID=M7Y5R8_9BACT|nr:hypothetical protein C943_01328 [Mariniradius saccharolyticus AK6]